MLISDLLLKRDVVFTSRRILLGGRRSRVLDVVIFEEEDESRFVGLLRVEAA